MPRGRKKREDVSPKVAGIEKAEIATKKGEAIDESLKAQFFREHTNDKNVTAAERKAGLLCACCEKEINDATGVYQPQNVFPAGFHPICLNCQQKYYARTAAETSRTYALFYCCHSFNVPYRPSVVAEITANQNGVWYEYIKKLQRAETDERGVNPSGWFEGVMKIEDAFSGEFPVLPITGDVLVANMREMSDRERWNIEWGEGMPDEECRDADDRYMMMTANRSGGMIPAVVSMYLHDAIRYMIKRDKSEDSMEAKRYQEMADKIMSSDSIKNWQANKGETVQVDKVARYLESIGAMQNGFLVGYDELVKILGNQHGSYNTSLDIVDCMMMCIINTMRRNNGDSELSKLPVSAQVTDTKGELLSEMSAEERKILEGLGMKPPEREKM